MATPPSPDPTPDNKKPQPLPWTNQETTTLIQAYKEKWYSLKKGPLKSSQWEEVSITIAARCGYDEPSKTAIQCQHKMEKLRKRYRAEVQLCRPSFWPYFDLMDQLVVGPLPISARPMTIIKCKNLTEPKEAEDLDNVNEENDNEDSDDERDSNKSKSVSFLLRTPSIVNRKLNNVAVVQTSVIRNHSKVVDVTTKGIDAEREEIGGGNVAFFKLAAEIRMYAEKFVKMENMRMEMMRETERFRMQMENKQTEMILNSTRRMVDQIGKAIGSCKKMKITTNQHI